MLLFLIFCWSRCSCSVKIHFWMPDQNGDNGDLDHVLFVIFELTKIGGLDQRGFCSCIWMMCVRVCVCLHFCICVCMSVFVYAHSAVT